MLLLVLQFSRGMCFLNISFFTNWYLITKCREHPANENVKAKTITNQPGAITSGYYNTMQVHNNHITTYAETSLIINITTVQTEVLKTNTQVINRM